MSTTARDTHLQVRISSEDKDLVRRAAQEVGLDVSSFVIQHLRRAADEVLAERTTFTLSDEDFDRFVERLDEPPRVLPGLRALAGEPSPFADH